MKNTEISTFFEQLLFLHIYMIDGFSINIIANTHGHGPNEYTYIISIQSIHGRIGWAYDDNMNQETNQNQFFLNTVWLSMINILWLKYIYQLMNYYRFIFFLGMYYMCNVWL